MALQPLAVTWNSFDAQRKPVTCRLLDPFRDLRSAARQIRHAGKSRPKYKTIAATAQAVQPFSPLVGGKPVDNGDRRCQIAFQCPEHDRLGRHVAFGKKNAEGQAISDRQTRQTGSGRGVRVVCLATSRNGTCRPHSCLGHRDLDRYGEDIAFSPHRLDVGWLARIVAEPLAQAAHQKVDRTVEQLGIAALREVQDLVAVEHALGMIDEDPQQPVFGTT